MPTKLKPERIGRKLYRDTNTNNTSNATKLQRSRSTVRRTADLQRQLAQHATISTSQEDEASVVSSVFIGGSSWGEEYPSFSGSFGSGVETHSSNNSGSSNNYGKQKSGKKIGLDALLNNQQPSRDTSDNASVISGTGSVAARRRAKAAWRNSQNSSGSLSNVDETQVNNATAVKSRAINPPPPSSSARRNMRMRMQNTTSGSSSKSYSQKNGSSNYNTNRNAFQLDETIDDEVNHALKELKLDHPEMDFDFHSHRLETRHSRGGSVDSNSSGRWSNPAENVSAGNTTAGKHPNGLGVLGESYPKPIQRGNHSPTQSMTSQKTTTTKSLTLEETSSTSRPIHTPPAAVGSSYTKNSAMGVSPVISVERVESVERCSESSSLTDTSDWHTANNAGSGTNMFKDANKGSFHKSKRIVRVGESISEHREVLSEELTKKPYEEKKGDSTLDTNSVLPSIQDRISQFKSGSNIPSPSQATSPSSSKSYKSFHYQKQQQQEKEKSSVYSTSSSSTIPTSYRSRNGLPPQAPTSSPFSVKLRKTKNVSSPKEEDGGEEGTNSSSFMGVKLRSTGGSWREKEREEGESPNESDDVVMEDSEEKVPHNISTLSESTRKLTYREQQDLLKQQQQQESSSISQEEPKKDVAALIRERIAMNKQQNQFMSSPKSASTEVDIGALRGNLKKTTYMEKRESTTPTHREMEEESPKTNELASIHSPKDESVSTPKQALNAMLSSRLGTPPAMEKKEDPPSDPRAALMAAIGNRASNDGSSSDSQKKNSSPKADPRDALMAAIGGKQSPIPDEDEEEALDPKANLAAMLQNRIAMGGGGTPSNNSAKKNVSAMLAKRTPPSPEVEEVGAPNLGSDGRPALKDDPKYAKYFKMLKGENIHTLHCAMSFTTVSYTQLSVIFFSFH